MHDSLERHPGSAFKRAKRLIEKSDATDGMGAMAVNGDHDITYLGPSSNVSFTRHITASMQRFSHPGEWNRSTEPPGSTLHDFTSTSQSIEVLVPGIPPSPASQVGDVYENIYFLPSEQETRRLLHQYFSDIGTGPTYPYIHEDVFMYRYQRMLTVGCRNVRNTFLGLLNIVLALAKSTSHGSDIDDRQRIAESEVFYMRSIAVCEKQIMRGSDLQVVQCLLVMCQYLQGTQRSVQTWNMHGLAVKAAYQLGLHSSDASSKLGPYQKEFRKRVWYGCILLDRILSMTYGRPAIIPEDQVRIELPIPYTQHVPTAVPAPPRECLSVAFYNATISLYSIIGKIVFQCYGGNLGYEQKLSPYDLVTRLAPIEQQLTGWRYGLPQDLTLHFFGNLNLYNTEFSLSERMKTMLTLRYHNVRLLLHRPVLIAFLDQSGSSDPPSQDLQLLLQVDPNSFHTCIGSASEIVSIVKAMLSSTGPHRMLLGAWWYTLYYTFNAALTIFASLLVLKGYAAQYLSRRGSTTDLRAMYEDAMQALRILDEGNVMVVKCVSHLQNLAQTYDAASDSMLSNRHPLGFPGHAAGRELNQVYPPATSYDWHTAVLAAPGIDLGEFMLESDSQLSDLFPVGASPSHG